MGGGSVANGLLNTGHFVADVTKDPENREKQLIVELQPVANKKVG